MKEERSNNEGSISPLQPSYTPDYTSYTKAPSHLARNVHPPGFFISEDLRQELCQQQMACLTLPVSEDICPKEVDSYHSLCPLETVDGTAPDQVRGLHMEKHSYQ